MAALELWISGIEKKLVQGYKNGYIKQSVDLHALAEFIVMSQEGAFGMSKSFKNVDIFKALHHSLKLYFQTIAA